MLESNAYQGPTNRHTIYLDSEVPTAHLLKEDKLIKKLRTTVEGYQNPDHKKNTYQKMNLGKNL